MRQLTCITSTLFLCLITIAVSAQVNLDSLYNVWRDEGQSDTVRADAFKSYIWKGFLFSQPDSAYILANQLVEFCKQKNYSVGVASALSVKGSSFHLRSDYDKARSYYQRSLAIHDSIGNLKGVASTLNNIATSYYYQNDYPQALEYYQRSLSVAERTKSQKDIGNALGNLGLVYNDLGNYDKALEYYHRSLAIREQMNDRARMANAVNNIGNVYKKQGNYSDALVFIERALEHYQINNDRTGAAHSYYNIGDIHFRQGKYSESLDNYQHALSLGKQVEGQNLVAASLVGIGQVNGQEGRYAQTLQYCKEGLDLAESADILKIQFDACQCLYDTYKAQGNTTKALEFYEQMVSLKDSLFNEENTKKLTQLEMQYEFDKKEAATQAEQEKKDAVAAQELKRQTMARNGFMGGFAVVLLFAGVFFTQRNRISKEKERSEELLLNILPEEVAEELKEKGHSDAQLIDEVTVLFTDFKGFTALSEKVTPKELVADLHECFSAFDRICEKYGIEKIKTIGDAYMAAGGLPSPNTTHAQDVVNAALEMAQVIEKGKMKKVEQGLPFFGIRIGVHTGPVVAGIVGVKKFQYDIWGDTVNTASRMESSGEAGKVNISESTYELVKDQFTCEYRGEVEAKGKGKLKMYFVV